MKTLLSRFYCIRRHSIAIKSALFEWNGISGCQDNRGGKKRMRTRNNVMLQVHVLPLYAFCASTLVTAWLSEGIYSIYSTHDVIPFLLYYYWCAIWSSPCDFDTFPVIPLFFLYVCVLSVFCNLIFLVKSDNMELIRKMSKPTSFLSRWWVQLCTVSDHRFQSASASIQSQWNEICGA